MKPLALLITLISTLLPLAGLPLDCEAPPTGKDQHWRSGHFEVAVDYASPWTLRKGLKDTQDKLNVTFANDPIGCELSVSIAIAPPDPHPGTLMSRTPMHAIYDQIEAAHPQNRSLQKSVDVDFHGQEYELHNFEVHHDKWGIRRADYLSRWEGKFFMIVTLTYPEACAPEMREFQTHHLRLMESVKQKAYSGKMKGW